MLVLVLNPGSSSLKYQLRDVPGGTPQPVGSDAASSGVVLQSGVIDAAMQAPPESRNARGVLHRIQEDLGRHVDGAAPDAVGHRVVHGGEQFTSPTMVTREVIEGISDLGPVCAPA